MAILTVGVGSGFDYNTLSSAVAASQDGDVIQVQAGTYTNDFAHITTNITIEGVGGMVNLVATETPLQEKGILIIGTDGTTGPDVTLDNISFSGAAISNDDGGNGAGIRYQSGNLTLNNCDFFDNQDGMLADSDPTGTITINSSEFADNGNANPPSTGIEHNLYVDGIQQLTIDNSYFNDSIVGHDIKSRAANTTIENSRIDDPNGARQLRDRPAERRQCRDREQRHREGPGCPEPEFCRVRGGGQPPCELHADGDRQHSPQRFWRRCDLCLERHHCTGQRDREHALRIAGRPACQRTGRLA